MSGRSPTYNALFGLTLLAERKLLLNTSVVFAARTVVLFQTLRASTFLVARVQADRDMSAHGDMPTWRYATHGQAQ